MPDPLPPILPEGTQVVTRTEIRDGEGLVLRARGAVAVVIQPPSDPWHAYRIRFPDGLEASVKRNDLAVLSHFQEGVSDPLVEHNLHKHIIYRCIIGSRAYGLDDAKSDTDYRGVYLPPADLHWSLYPLPEQLERPDHEECYWELQKFLTLALKANPNILECLYTPLVEYATPLAHELLSLRQIFLSKLLYQTYNGYVLSQFKKLQTDLRNTGEPKWKHLMHLLRLLLSGITALKENTIQVHVGPHREKLLAIKRGEIPMKDLEVWRLDLHKQFDQAAAQTTLPDRPDYEKANAFLLKARRSML